MTILDNAFADAVRHETALENNEPHGGIMTGECWCFGCDDLFSGVARSGNVTFADLFGLLKTQVAH